MATFTAQYWLGSAHNSTEFEADERLRDDSEQLEKIARRELRLKFGRNTADRAEFTGIYIELDRDAIANQIRVELDKLSEQGYNTNLWSIEATVEDAIRQFEETGNSVAEIRYDGLKYFTVNAIY